MASAPSPEPPDCSERSFPTPFHLGGFLARSLTQIAVVRAGCRIAQVCHETGQDGLVSQLLAKALQDARDQPLEEDRVDAFVTVAETASDCGDAELARKALGLARLHVGGMEKPFDQAFAWIHMADCHHEMAEAEPAREALARSLELAKGLPPPDRIGVWVDALEIYQRMGDSLAVAGLLGQAAAEAASLDDRDKAGALGTLANAYLDAGRTRDARECLDQAALLETSADESAVVRLFLLVETHADRLKNPEQGRTLAARIQDIAQQIEAGHGRDFSLGMAARAWFKAGDPDRALQCAGQTTGAWRVRQWCHLAGQFQKCHNDSSRALQLLVDALRLVEGLKPREKDRVRFPLFEACMDLHALAFDDPQREIAHRAAEQLAAKAPSPA